MRAIVLVAVLGCASNPQATAQHGACTALEGKLFTSTTEHECGLGPNGPVPCHWHVTIDAGDGSSSVMTWSYSDVEQTLRVTCDGTAITSAMPAYAGTFDPATATLTWDSVDYAE
jgi:hypothetical protein